MTILTTKEVAELLRTSETVVKAMARSGQLPARKVGRAWRFHKEAIEKSLVSENTKGRRP